MRLAAVVVRPTAPPESGRHRNVVIFFEEKVGSTALVSLLDRFRDVCIVQLDTRVGLEPFDRHNCGPMGRRRLRRCLNAVLGGETERHCLTPVCTMIAIDWAIVARRRDPDTHKRMMMLATLILMSPAIGRAYRLGLVPVIAYMTVAHFLRQV